MLRMIICESKFQLTIGIFSITFVMLRIKKLTEFLNTLTMNCDRIDEKHSCNGFICVTVFVDYSTFRVGTFFIFC